MSYSPDESLNDKYRELCLAVGNLFITFGRLEGTLSSILRLHLINNLSNHLGDLEGVQLSSAIYGSMRLKAAKDTLRRLAKVEGTSEKIDAFLDEIFTQVAHVETLRNYLAHRTIVPAPDETSGDLWQISDQTVTRDIKNLKIYAISTEAIVAARHDLDAAGAHIGNNTQGKTLFGNITIAPLSWHYKPSMLKYLPLGTRRTAG